MARLITCVCGRRFHIGHSNAEIQCRNCGRSWSGRNLGTFEAALKVLGGGEIARANRKKGSHNPSSRNSCRKRQTNRDRPRPNPVGAVLRFFLG